MAYSPSFFNCWKAFCDWTASLIAKTPNRPSPKAEASTVDKPSTVYKIGPCGGHGGGLKDMNVNSKIRILKIGIRHAEGIDAIRISFQWDGIHKWTEWWGGSGGQSSEFNLAEDEDLTSIRGHYGYLRPYLVVRSLTFVSNKATYGPYGEENGTPFTLHAQGGKIVGFFARCGQFLDAIGIYTI